MTPIGSRRIDEVNPVMYSAVARLSSDRAAPAKNWIWSHIDGISSLIVRPLGLAVFSASISTSRSAFCSIASASLRRYATRSLGGGGAPARPRTRSGPRALPRRRRQTRQGGGGVGVTRGWVDDVECLVVLRGLELAVDVVSADR